MDNFLRSETNAQAAFRTCQYVGVTTHSAAQALAGLTASQTRTALEELCNPADPLLTAVPVSLAAQRGRPTRVYLLTDRGTLELGELLGILPRHPICSDDTIEISHRLVMLELILRAQREQLTFEVERELRVEPYYQVYRPDLIIQDAEGKQKVLFEIEQSLLRVNIQRAVEKLQKIGQLLASNSEYDSSVRFVFNAVGPELETTIAIWQEALSMASTGQIVFPAHILWTTLPELLASESLLTTGKYRTLHPAPVTAIHTTPRPGQGSKWFGLSDNEMDAAMNYAYSLPEIDWPQQGMVRERLETFRSIIQVITEAPWHADTGYFGYPVGALRRLRGYLHAPGNEALLTELQQSMTWAIKQARFGGAGMRDALTQVIWVFLRHHGFGRHGFFDATVVLLSYDEQPCSYYPVRVLLRGNARDIPFNDLKMRQFQQQLAWVLECLYIYAVELGLSEYPWVDRRTKRTRKAG